MIYLDHAATSLPRSPAALDAAREGASLANPGRGLHHLQRLAAERVATARQAVAELVGGATVTFHAGATAALNQAIAGLRPRPRAVALGPLVHNAARRPALALGAPCWTLPHDAAGRVDVDRVRDEWRPETDLVVLTHASNVTGTVQPVEALCEVARKAGARVVLDAAQTAGVLSVAVGADLIAFSAHKHLGGIPGTGVLAIASEMELEPLVKGGVGFDAAEDAMPAELPARLEAGTPNLPGILALGAAVRGAGRWDPAPVAAALDGAVRAAGLEPLGRVPGPHLPTTSVRVPGLAASTFEELLDRVYGVIARGGLHCAPAAHRVLGTLETGSLRLSAGPSTGGAEIDEVGRALRQLVDQVKGS